MIKIQNHKISLATVYAWMRFTVVEHELVVFFDPSWLIPFGSLLSFLTDLKIIRVVLFAPLLIASLTVGLSAIFPMSGYIKLIKRLGKRTLAAFLGFHTSKYGCE